MAASQKHFRKRDAIYDYLLHSKAHPSAEMVYAQLKPEIPDLAMGTVYRNLNHFKEQGLVSSIATVRGTERFDANTRPHVHFICSDCDAVIDLDEMQIPDSLGSAAAYCCGGQVTLCHLHFTGVCRDCLARTTA